MSVIRKYAFVLMLATAVIYTYEPLSLKDVKPWFDQIKAATSQVWAKPEVGGFTIDPVAKANIDEDLDYRIAQRIGSLEGWRSFLTAHGNGRHAQSARAEVEKLLPAAKPPAPIAAALTKGEPADAKAAGEAAPPLSGREDFDASRSHPHEEICKQDEDRLAQLQAKPSLDEGVRFASELRCPKLWPQFLAVLDSLSHTAGSAGVSVSNGAALDAMSAGGAAPPPASSSPEMEATPATSDDVCKHDEDRLAELQAKPSLDEGGRFASELRCMKLWPQLLTVLDSLSHTAGSAGVSVSNGAAPDAMSAGGAAPPPASSSPEMEAAPATSDDVRKHDEDRLAELQAKPSLDEAMRFGSDLRCPKLRPQLLAMLKGMSDPAHSNESSGVAASARVDDSPLHSTERTADPPGANIASDEVCKRDEERLARLRHTPSSDEAARFAEELSCEKLRPQLLALTGDLASASPPDSAGVSKDTGAETSAGAAPPSPSERVDSALGPKQRATVPPSNARWTTSSRRLEPKQHANGCAAKPACSWRASSLPPIHLGVFHHDRRVEEANQGSAPYTPSRGKMAAQSPFEAPLRPPWIRVFTFRVRG